MKKKLERFLHSLTLQKKSTTSRSSCCSETEYVDRENITTMLCSLECKKALKFNSVITIFPKQYFPQSLLPPEIVDSNNFVCTLPGAKLHRIKSNYLLSCLRYSVSLWFVSFDRPIGAFHYILVNPGSVLRSRMQVHACCAHLTDVNLINKDSYSFNIK